MDEVYLEKMVENQETIIEKLERIIRQSGLARYDDYLPVNLAGLFSMKAVEPSSK